jgi:hypothetical protein
MKPNFTSAAIDAATQVFALMAMKSTVEEKYTRLQEIVLKELKLAPDPKIVEKLKGRGVEVPDYVRNDRELLFLEMGVDEKGNAPAHLPIAKYYSEIDRRTKNIGLIHGMNAICVVDTELRNARECLFIEAQKMPSMPPIEWDRLTSSLDFYRKYFDLTLKLFAQKVKDNPNYNRIAKFVADSHIQPSFITA